jgi:hypothetical protein
MKWENIVLLPKGGGDYCGIGLLEPFWKVIEKIMVAQLLSVEFHENLHGRLPGRGTGTAMIKAKLHQSLLAWRNQCPLYQIYVVMKKAYDALDWERTLKILAAYGVGPKLLALQKHFWETAMLVCRARGNYGEPFGAEQGVTQGGPLSSLMLNVCVDAVVREWLHQMLGEEAAHDGLGDRVVKILVAFYVNKGLIASRDPVCWRNPSTSLLDYLNGLVCSQMQTRQRQWFVFRGGLERTRQKRSMPNTNHRRRPPTVNVVECTVKFAAPALQLDPIEVIWSRSMTFFGPLFSNETL